MHTMAKCPRLLGTFVAVEPGSRMARSSKPGQTIAIRSSADGGWGVVAVVVPSRTVGGDDPDNKRSREQSDTCNRER